MLLFDRKSMNLMVRSVSSGLVFEGLMSSYTELGVRGSSTTNHQWRLLTYLDRNWFLFARSWDSALGKVMVVP